MSRRRTRRPPLQRPLPEPDRCGPRHVRGQGPPSGGPLPCPAEKIRFDDLIRGEVEFDNGLLGDFVIVRADGVPLYHFVVVIDDEQMEISHVLRGEDHLSNTPSTLP